MLDLDALLTDINEYNNRYTLTKASSNADKIVCKIVKSRRIKELEEVTDFLNSDASDEDKDKVLCHWIKM